MIQYLFRITPWVLFIVLSSCNSDFTPRPRSYFSVELPKKDYQAFNQVGYPYSFEYPVYANISKEVDSSQNDLYWINIDFKGFNGRIYLSYKDLNGYSI